MSTQKLRVLKKIKGVDSYSTNPLIDSLIKQKLQSQMAVVKDNFNHLLRRQQQKSKQDPPIPSKSLRKRHLSTHNLSALTPQKIQSSLAYHPAPSETLAFIHERQLASPLLTPSALSDLHKARSHHEDLLVKIKHTDKISYPTPTPEHNYFSNIEHKVKTLIPNDVWLPAQPEVEEILSSRMERDIGEKGINNQPFQLTFNERPPSEGFNPIRGTRHLRHSSGSLTQNQSSQAAYDSKKYHKSDYQSLQKWLEIAVDFVNKQVRQHSKYEQNSAKVHLNQIYTVYVCAMKQLIRLTYIESAEKGLVLQKLIWSMVRLFEQLIKEQHKLNYAEFKEISKESKQHRNMFQARMQKLQQRLAQREQSLQKTLQQKKIIFFTALSYKKVNQQMNAEINNMMSLISQQKKQNGYLTKNLIKLVKQFQDREIIKIQTTEDASLYYYLNSKNKIQVVAKVPRKNALQQHFKQQMSNAIKSMDLVEQSQIQKLDNVLTNYWQKKRQYLNIDSIFKEQFMHSLQDNSTQADGHGPQSFAEVGFQYPPQGQQTFEQFLRNQLTEQRQTWTLRQQQYVSTQISLRDLYDQLKETITILTGQNTNLKQAIDHKDHQIIYLNKKITQLQQKITLLNKKIANLDKDMADLKIQDGKLREQIQQSIAKVGQEKKKYFFQKQNNNILAASNHSLRQKMQQLRTKFERLEQKIKTIAPHLEQTMSLAESSQDATLLSLTTAIELHLSEYVEKASKVFLTH